LPGAEPKNAELTIRRCCILATGPSYEFADQSRETSAFFLGAKWLLLLDGLEGIMVALPLSQAFVVCPTHSSK